MRRNAVKIGFDIIVEFIRKIARLLDQKAVPDEAGKMATSSKVPWVLQINQNTTTISPFVYFHSEFSFTNVL